MNVVTGHPGSGYWERDNSHFPSPMSRHQWELFVPAYERGTRIGLARYGCAIDHFEFSRIHGRLYVRTCFARDPEELRRRSQTAERVLATKLWRQDREAWVDVAASLRRRLIAFSRQDPATLDACRLLERLAALREIFLEGTIQHFVQQPASMFAVGDWIRRTSAWTGASKSEVLAVLRNSSSESADYMGTIDALAEAIRANAAAAACVRDHHSDAATRLQSLRKTSPAVQEILDAYVDEYADRIVTGFDITDATLRELPQFVLSVIGARLDGTNESPMQHTPLQIEANLRARVPLDCVAEYDEALAEARSAYGLHDEDVRITYLWPLGVLRRTVRAAAQLLVARGALLAADDVFQTTPEELAALVAGGAGPSAEELAGRSEQWRAWAHEEPPASFGSREPELPEGFLSPECARITGAITFYLAEMEAQAKPSSPGSWSRLIEGLPASPGRYEGRARIIRGPADFGRLSFGDVIVARTTSPAYNIILPILGGVVTDRGGTLCHAAIVAREFGIPAVVGTNQATLEIPDGAQVLVDGDRGFVAVRQ